MHNTKFLSTAVASVLALISTKVLCSVQTLDVQPSVTATTSVVGPPPIATLNNGATAPTGVVLETRTQGDNDDILERALLPPVRSAEDDRFLDAWKLAQKGQWDKLNAQISTLEGYPLLDYLKLASMNGALKRTPSDNALQQDYERFIAAHKGDYLAERATSDLLMIAARAMTQGQFNRLYKTLAWNKEEPPILAAWFIFNASRQNLSQRFAFYRDTNYRGEFLEPLGNSIGASTKNWPWTKLLIALQKQRWQDATATLKNVDKKTLPTSAKDLTTMLKNPAGWVKKNEAKLSNNPRLALLYALRIAPANSEGAAEVISVVSDKLPRDERNMVWATIGYHGATDLSANASAWFSHVTGNIDDNALLVQSDIKLSWAIRAALWSQKWEEVERLTRKLPESMQSDETWIYWRARALSALNQPERAQPLYRSIASSTSFYGKLAADMLNVAYFLPQAGTVVLPAVTEQRWQQTPSIARAETFYRLELYFMGHREWNWAMRDLSSPELNQLAEYAKSRALLHRMINTAQRVNPSEQRLEHLFPMPHRQQFEPIAEQQGTPLAWVYGVIRQESRFMPSVTSSAGAQGLMQIMPKTARWLTRKLSLPALSSTADLHDLNTNVMLGSAFLNMLRSDLADSYVLATAAYNAGPGRARKWRSMLANPIEGAIFIECIPFNETRDYVKNVMANTHTFFLLDGHSKTNFTQLISSIEPNADLNTDLP